MLLLREIHFSTLEAHDPPLRRTYLKMMGVVVGCFIVGFSLFDFAMVINFREERLKNLQGSVKELAWHLDFCLFAIAQTVNRLEGIFLHTPSSPGETLRDFFTPLPTSSTQKEYGRIAMRDIQKAALLELEGPVSALDPTSLSLVASFVTESEKKVEAVVRLFPHLDGLLYVSPSFRFFYPWVHFPPRLDPLWVQKNQNLQFSVLKATESEGWRPLSCGYNAEEWTLSYVRPHFSDGALQGFFALTLKPLFFQKALEHRDIPFGRCLIVDGEGKKMLHKDSQGIDSAPAFLQEVLPLGLGVQEVLAAPPGKMIYHEVTWWRGYWVCVLSLPKVPFKIIYWADSSELFLQEFRHLRDQLTWQVLLMLSLLLLNYWLIQHLFTKPLTRLMAHLNQERLGLRTQGASFSSTWKLWAEFISSVFREKKRRAKELDIRLQEKVCELRRMLSHLQNLEDHLAAQENSSSLGTLAMGMACVLKSPLQGIINRVSALQQELQDLPDMPKRQALTDQTEVMLHHLQMAQMLLQPLAFLRGRPCDSPDASTRLDLCAFARGVIVLCYHGFRLERGEMPLMLEISHTAHPVRADLPARAMTQLLVRLFATLAEELLQSFRKRQSKGTLFIPRLHVTLTQEEQEARLAFEVNVEGHVALFSSASPPGAGAQAKEMSAFLAHAPWLQEKFVTISMERKEGTTVLLLRTPIA